MSTLIYKGGEDAFCTLEQMLPPDVKRERFEGELRVTIDDGDESVRVLDVEHVER